MLDDVVTLLSGAVQFIGGALIVLGAVNLGIGLKDGMTGGGAQLSGAIALMVSGALIIAFAKMFS